MNNSEAANMELSEMELSRGIILPKTSRIQLSEAISMGSMIVPRPWSVDVERCAIGMALTANGIKPVRCDPILLLYSWLEKIFTCPWCENPNPGGASFLFNVPEFVLLSMFVVAHPFAAHVLTGQITLDQLCRWIASIEPDPRFYGVGEDTILKTRAASKEKARPVLLSVA